LWASRADILVEYITLIGKPKPNKLQTSLFLFLFKKKYAKAVNKIKPQP
jgi:hypothetical protein